MNKFFNKKESYKDTTLLLLRMHYSKQTKLKSMDLYNNQ